MMIPSVDLALVAALALLPALPPAVAGPHDLRAPVPVDLALCLDTSGSMDGLIDAAKSRLWAIVNDLARAEPVPDLRVALLTYGNDGHDAENGWVRLDVAFTRDLDLVSQQLFALATNGGTEYVGRVVDRATHQLAWSDVPSALRLLVVAGNEAATQDPSVLVEDAARAAIARGIQVDAIYCGSPSDADASGWSDVARLADGQFACIDQDGAQPIVATPFDDDLLRLSGLLNATYVPWGGAGGEGLRNQAAQDGNALAMGAPAAAERASAKAGALYRCAWDLLDALDAGDVTLSEVERDGLPDAFAGLDDDTLAKRLASLREDRSELQRQIGELSAQREAFVAEALANASADEDVQGFERVLRDAVRRQAEVKGLRFATSGDTLP